MTSLAFNQNCVSAKTTNISGYLMQSQKKSHLRYHLWCFFTAQTFPHCKQHFVLHIIHYMQVAWIKGNINLRHLVQSYWYVACKKCQRASSCTCGQRYKCNDCGHEQIAIPRYYTFHQMHSKS